MLEEDNRKLIELLGNEGNGRIVVVQYPKRTSAIFGDRLTERAMEHHWGSMIIDGAICGSQVISDTSIGSFAANCCS
ncbi:MAG: hypothetical protein HOO87_16190 [Methyloglobulus sp.]|nr:hypothetical protein [Methyloglobulus sp.]